MDPRTQERVEQWDSRPFSGGYDGLSSLADQDFSGAVSASGGWVFMLNGRIVGVVDGRLEAFEGASGTAYEAPHPSVPLLHAMDEQGGETRAKYYTNDTPIVEVDRTLQSGSFTGYVELSEQVLSGDYYLVYYGGRRMAAAYIGNAQRLLTGDEAFERADDEVGIYEVVDVDLEVQDVPGADDDGGSSGASAGDAEPGASAGTGATEPAAEPTPTDVTSHEPDATETSGSGIEIDLEAAAGLETEPASPDEADDRGDRATEVALDDGVPGHAEDDSDHTSIDESDEEGERTESEPTTDADTEPESTTAIDTEPEAQTTADADTEPESPVDDAKSDETDADTSPDQASNGITTTSTPVEEPSRGITDQSTGADSDQSEASMDPADVEAAAAELEKGGVSWDPPAESAAEPSSESAAEPSSEGESPLDERLKQEERWRETRQIPSIDPEKSSSSARKSRSDGRRGAARSSRRQSAGPSQTRSRTETSKAESRSTARSPARRQAGEAGRGAGQSDASETSSTGSSPPESEGTTQGSSTGNGSRSPPSREALERDMLEREDKIDRLTQRVDELEEEKAELAEKADTLESERELLAEERDGYREQADELSATVDRLQGRIEELEAELAQVREARAAGVPMDATEMRPQEVLQQTNLFVRYGSKSDPTLQSAHDEADSRDAVIENLRLEHHTQFDDSSVVVDGQPFEEFLRSTMEYQFVEWLTDTLLFEIRDTGRRDGLVELYDALPRIDRVELQASISLADDDTEGVPESVTFDVVVFDKRGNPLVAANLNDSREPATRDMLESLEESASAVKANYPELGGAFVVTSSFFEPGALEVAERATSNSGFLSRDARLSFVSLSRKQGGYHLCLVESRSGGFHMNVPEL